MARRNRNSELKRYKSDSTDSSESSDASETKNQRKNQQGLNLRGRRENQSLFCTRKCTSAKLWPFQTTDNETGCVHKRRSSVASSNFKSLSNNLIFKDKDIKKKTKRKKTLLRQTDNDNDIAALRADNVKQQFCKISNTDKKDYTMQVIHYYLESTKGVIKKHSICKEMMTLISTKDWEFKKELKEIKEKN